MALLIALLLPSLSKAKETARRVICASQLKQWGQVYFNYAASYREFVGGVAVWELRDILNSNYAESSPGVPSNGYWWSPWGQSTLELPKFGLTDALTYCPSRTASGYVTASGTPRIWEAPFASMGPGSIIKYTDYWIFAGFSNDPDALFTPSYNESNAIQTYGHSIGLCAHNYFTDARRQPVTRLTQRRSLRTVMVMDRHWVVDTQSVTYTYNDLGNISNHIQRGSIAGASPLAEGSNALLLDGSVQWTNQTGTFSFFGSTYSNTTYYGKDYYREFRVGKNLQYP